VGSGVSSSWGSSWGQSWGSSWGTAGPVVEIASMPFTVTASGFGFDLMTSNASLEVQISSIDFDIEAS
jgi:hypothetical protein